MKYIGSSFQKTICLILYYTIAQYLPQSGQFWNVGGKTRRFLCKRIFKKCGTNVNVERKAYFGNGSDVEIGDYSGIGVNAVVPQTTHIGNNVMMGPNCYILERNHNFSRTDIPMREQGYQQNKPIVIEDDVWIGRDVLMTPGRHISRGTIIAAGCVLCNDFPEFSIVGGNPSKFIKYRKQ